MLAEYPRNAIADARQMTYSEVKADVRPTFADSSWVRPFTGNPESAMRLTRVLSGAVRAIPEGELTSGQRKRVARFTAGLPANAQPPTFTRLPSGIRESSWTRTGHPRDRSRETVIGRSSDDADHAGLWGLVRTQCHVSDPSLTARARLAATDPRLQPRPAAVRSETCLLDVASPSPRSPFTVHRSPFTVHRLTELA
jgi:hypothetical protein